MGSGLGRGIQPLPLNLSLSQTQSTHPCSHSALMSTTRVAHLVNLQRASFLPSPAAASSATAATPELSAGLVCGSHTPVSCSPCSSSPRSVCHPSVVQSTSQLFHLSVSRSSCPYRPYIGSSNCPPVSYTISQSSLPSTFILPSQPLQTPSFYTFQIFPPPGATVIF